MHPGRSRFNRRLKASTNTPEAGKLSNGRLLHDFKDVPQPSRNAGTGGVRTLLYEAANVMLTRYKGQLKLKDWAFAIAKRSTMRKARVALARRLAIIMHAIYETGRSSHRPTPAIHETGGPNRAPERSRRR